MYLAFQFEAERCLINGKQSDGGLRIMTGSWRPTTFRDSIGKLFTLPQGLRMR
jgi:hypothetical protein